MTQRFDQPGAKVALMATAALGLAVSMNVAFAGGDMTAGRKRAIACAGCHGIDGLAKLPGAANLAGESPQYLEKQIKAFRAGDRKDENMNIAAKNLSDQEIADLVAWYSAIEITVKLPGQ